MRLSMLRQSWPAWSDICQLDRCFVYLLLFFCCCYCLPIRCHVLQPVNPAMLLPHCALSQACLLQNLQGSLVYTSDAAMQISEIQHQHAGYGMVVKNLPACTTSKTKSVTCLANCCTCYFAIAPRFVLLPCSQVCEEAQEVIAASLPPWQRHGDRGRGPKEPL